MAAAADQSVKPSTRPVRPRVSTSTTAPGVELAVRPEAEREHAAHGQHEEDPEHRHRHDGQGEQPQQPAAHRVTRSRHSCSQASRWAAISSGSTT